MTDSIEIIPEYSMQQYDCAMQFLLSSVNPFVTTVIDKIVQLSEQLLGKPYLMGALGEGPNAQFDQNPRYRDDAFDCVTFVNTVLALALSPTLHVFQQKIIELNYYHQTPTYHNRYHFMSVDWNIQNAKQGVIEDITAAVQLGESDSSVQTAVTTIDRAGWFAKRSLRDIKLLQKNTAVDCEKLLRLLHQPENALNSEQSCVPYIPLKAFFDPSGKVCHAILAQIPQAAIIEIVRPNWALREKIGTNLNISHLGFAIWRGGELYFRQATSQSMRVEDTLLTAYLKKCLDSPTIGGINIAKIIA